MHRKMESMKEIKQTIVSVLYIYLFIYFVFIYFVVISLGYVFINFFCQVSFKNFTSLNLVNLVSE